MSEKPKPFGSVLTAMVTPFRDDLTVDFDKAAELAADLVALGNDGLVINGTTGESATTTPEEKIQLLKTVRSAVGGNIRIIAGVGTNDTYKTIENAIAAERVGVDGLLVVCPYYNKPPQEGLYQHFISVANATGLGIMLYDIPGRSGVAISSETLLRLAEHPRILANKDAKGDLYQSSVVMSQSDLVYYSGEDALNLPLLSIGAVGLVSVTGHLVADRLREMLRAFESGNHEYARTINDSLVPVTTGVMTKLGGAIMVKAALDLLGRSGGGAVRLPYVVADQTQREELREYLRLGGFDL
ncbi:MAG: 4-hydroxy-tetrahydrodipicolinate synthase, partial [Actinomycetota bacterium]|jgi:4-hydroxy-tetrahydrodipicolinate synthase